jgi:hypothetical protein
MGYAGLGAEKNSRGSLRLNVLLLIAKLGIRKTQVGPIGKEMSIFRNHRDISRGTPAVMVLRALSPYGVSIGVSGR